MNKVKGYFAAFLVGGIIGSIAFLVFTAYLMAGKAPAIALPLMVYTMALFGGILTIVGIYQKITLFAGMGAMMPMCGLSGGIAEFITVLRGQGLPAAKVIKMGLTAPAKIFGVCYGFALVLALISTLANLSLIPTPNPMAAVGFAPAITGFQAIGILNAFIVSGVLCLIGQLFFVNTRLGFVKIFIGCVSLGSLLAVTGFMDYITGWASAGMVVSVVDAGEAAYLGFKAAILAGDFSAIIRFTILVVGVLATGVVCGFLAKKVDTNN